MERILCGIKGWIVLLLCLICTNLCAQTSDGGVSNETELRNAINGSYERVYLKNSFSINSTLDISRSVELDLNKCTLTRSGSGNVWTGKYINILCVKVLSGNVIITNGTIIGQHIGVDGYASGLEMSGGTLKLVNVTIEGKITRSTGTFDAPSTREATGIQYYGGDLYIISGTFSGLGEGKGTSGAKNAIWAKSTAINNFFKGSYLKKGNNVVSNLSTTEIDGSVTAHPITYTLNYQLMDGTITSLSHVTSYKALDILDKSIQSLPGVSKEGYQFNHWNCNDGTSTKQITNSLELPCPYVTKDSHTLTLTADWSPIPYTIQYNMNGGINNSNNIDSYDITQSTVELKEPQERVGYEFVGWFDGNGNSVKTISYEQVKNSIDQTYIITARWKPIDYTITFEVETTNGKSLSYTVETTETALPDPKNIPSGQEFDGWVTSSGDKITAIPITNPSNLNLSPQWKDITYYAYFYDENGMQLSSLTKSYFAKDGLSSSQIPQYSKEGYVFEGWFKEDDKNHASPITSIIKGTAGNTKLYAYLTPIQYSLLYHLNGGSYSGQNPAIYTLSAKAKLPTDKDVSYIGYTFKGWYLQDKFSGSVLTEVPISGGDKSDGGRKVSFEAYAKWEKNEYTITFKTDGGTPVDNATYNITDGVPAEKMPKTSKVGYKFLGWFIGDQEKTFIEPGYVNLVLQAKWELIQYSIIYHLNGGTNPSQVKSTYNYEDALELPKPTRKNYIFNKWYEDKNFEGEGLVEIPNHTTGDKVFYANWIPEQYTISFETNGGSEIVSQKYTYGEVTEFSRKTRKKDYTFAGWYKDAALTAFFGDKISATTSGDFKLYAKWVPEVYKIEYDCYYGSNPSDAPASYTKNDEIILPTPVRDNFTFAGWYDNDYLTGEKQTKIAKGSSGNVKFYATWTRANAVSFTQPQNGKIIITQGGKELKNGDRVGAGIPLTITATTATDYVLQNMVINGTSYTSSPQIISMPEKDGVVVTAAFIENPAVPTASAPEIIITPSGVDKFPKGEDVKVQLKKTDESTTLYYNLAGVERKYEKEFVVASPQDTVLLKAIARKQGLRDGVISRYIIFDNGKITLTFNLPLGVKAVNPSGGEVVTATTTGGSFEFELKVDREYYTNLDSMVVSANDSVIKAGSAGLYTLTNCTSDVTITVAGLKAKVCNVTLQQTDNGTISFTDGAEETTMEVEYGASVSVTAKADEDFKFLQWSTGSQSNPLKLTVDKDTTISARFINDYKAYAITLPQLEGVTVRPFTGYSTEVKKDGTFKFYLKLADGYREENPVVRANGEVLAKNKGGYAIYKVNKNISISVEGIVREPVTLKVPGNVNAKVVETMNNASTQEVYEETMILLHAEAPAGKIFDKWTDGKTDNPRMVPAVDAEQLHPLFTNKGDANYAKVILNQSPGAGITAVNANIDGVKNGETVQLNVVLLPAYSQSEVTLTVDDEVLKPSVSLRAASETKTYMYSLPVKKDEVTVKVSGMKLNTYNVSLAQTDGGVVYSNPAGTATHGDKIQLKAQPEPGMLFVKWWDGNTLNPYPYTVTADTEVKASFLGAESTVDNESIRKDDPIEITTDGNRLSIKVDKEYQVYIFNFGGGLYQKRKIPAGGYSMYLPSGEYLVKVGDDIVRKVIIL